MRMVGVGAVVMFVVVLLFVGMMDRRLFMGVYLNPGQRASESRAESIRLRLGVVPPLCGRASGVRAWKKRKKAAAATPGTGS
jgi:hypothetical protein